MQHPFKVTWLARLRALWRRRRPLPPGARRISLALQGGGSHGAFTWGVLDRLLEDVSTLDIERTFRRRA